MKKEGDLYKVITVFGKTFQIYYGYYEDYERYSKFNEPIPIYPDLKKTPEYTADGYPIVTEMQVGCENFVGDKDENICYKCKHFRQGEELFGLCVNNVRRKK